MKSPELRSVPVCRRPAATQAPPPAAPVSDARSGYPELLADLVDVLEEYLRVDLGLIAPLPASIATAIADWIRTAWGGRKIHVGRANGPFVSNTDDTMAARFLRDLAARAREILVLDHGLVERADILGEQIAGRVQREFATEKIYLPRGQAFDIERRNQQIFEAYNGRNGSALAHKYGISDARVYQIVAAMRAKVPTPQLRLF